MSAAAGWPDWLVRRLVGQGLMDADTGATRKARAVACDRCGRAVWRGLDAEWCARSRDADPVPVSALGEAQAVIAGRRTLELSGTMRLELNYRDAWRIAGRPAGRGEYDVVVEHKCGDLTQFDRDNKVRDAGNRPDNVLPDNPPF